MKRIFVALFLVVCSAFAAGQTAGWTNVTASHIYGGSTALGPQLLPAGTISFQPTDNTGKFIAVAINGGAEEVNYPITCQITNGVIQSGCYVPDISLTNPIDICELVTVKNQSGTVILGGSPKSGYQCAQPEGSSWSFDTFVPYVPGWPLLSTPIARIGLVGLVQAPNCLTLGAGYVPQSLNTDGTWNCVNTSGGGGSGVTSWNGRTGAVVPLTGDYSVGQVTNALSNQLNSAEIYVGNSSNIAYPVSMTGDCSISPSGQVTCLKSNGRTFGAAAFLGASGNGPDAATTSVSNDTSGQSACWDGSHNVTNIGCTGGSDTGVSSFNGRTGAVYPATGDYTYAEISGTPALGTAATANLSGSASEAASTSVSNDTAGQTTCWDGNHNVTNQGCSNGLVISFNGRVGAVVPANGDYTYSQISGTPMLGAAAALGVTGTGTKAVTSNGLSGASGSGVCQDGSGNLTGSGCTSGTVTSWNGRTGAVVPATNDYSFSQISGPLLHSQLPALLATDIPNNYANTTGTAGGLSNNITESQVTNLVSDLANRAVLNGANTFTGDQTAPGFCIGSSCVTSWPSYTLPPPTLSSLGGVLAKDCSTFGANYVLQKINADGSETCVLGGGGGGSYPDITDTPSVSVTIAVPTFVDGVIASTESGGAKGIGGTFGPAPAGMSGATNDLIACGSGIWNIWGSNTGNVIDLCFNSSTVYTIAPLQSPAFTGAPTAPTQTTSDTSTDIATDAFVHNVVSAGGGMVYPSAGVANSTGSAWGTSYQVGTSANDLVQLNGSSQLPAVSGTNLTGLAVGQVSGAAPLASPALTGTPTVPTASPGTNTTQAASTAFVQAAVTAGSGIPSTTNVIKGNGSGAGLPSSIVDDGTDPTLTPNGINTGANGLNNANQIGNDNPGTVQYELACVDSSKLLTVCPAATTQGVMGVCEQNCGNSGIPVLCTSSCAVKSHTSTTVANWLIPSASTAGYVDDSGLSSVSQSNPSQQSFVADTAVSSGSNVVAEVFTPYQQAGGAGGGGNASGPYIQTNGTLNKSVSNFNGSTPSPDTNYIALAFKSSNSGKTTSIIAEAPYATSSTFGVVKPDNSTITVSGGVISAPASGLTNVVVPADLYYSSITGSVETVAKQNQQAGYVLAGSPASTQTPLQRQAPNPCVITASTNTLGCNFASATVASSLVYVSATVAGTFYSNLCSSATVTDNLSHSYTPTATNPADNHESATCGYFLQGAAAGITSVTFTINPSQSNTPITLAISEWQNMQTSSALDHSVNPGGYCHSSCSGVVLATGVTSYANDLVITTVSQGDSSTSWSTVAPFQSLAQQENNSGGSWMVGMQYAVGSTATNYPVSITVGGGGANFVALVDSFKALTSPSSQQPIYQPDSLYLLSVPGAAFPGLSNQAASNAPGDTQVDLHQGQVLNIASTTTNYTSTPYALITTPSGASSTYHCWIDFQCRSSSASDSSTPSLVFTDEDGNSVTYTGTSISCPSGSPHATSSSWSVTPEPTTSVYLEGNASGATIRAHAECSLAGTQ